MYMEYWDLVQVPLQHVGHAIVLLKKIEFFKN